MLRALVVACAAVAVSVGCRPAGHGQGFHAVDITGAGYARELALRDSNGERRTLADFRGKVVIVFFGYAHCPDVCPTTLADMAEVKRRLGKDGERLQVIFVTVDPERDSPQVLTQYAQGFDPSFIALTGTPEEIARAAREFKVFYQKVPGKRPTDYTIDHTAGSYVFDTEGRVRLFIKHAQGVDAIVADLKRLLG
ncbi:MAG: SCO family protein [Sutterellaceae bacterium]|nr:SCO family protein [Burkholderiaceae bacterium]MCX7901033.1 SCO family protein [Burkholderiaceae bacterium]MDW8430636.1 SCO family protein [Sutterellaceae bacterium]